MAEMSLIQTLVVWTPPVLLAVTLHEVAHGWVARELGDDTAEALGRLSFNPLKHVDPVGTVLVPGLLYALAGIVFGWAKPVPVNWDKLRNPRRDMALVAVAGPLANVVMLLRLGRRGQVRLCRTARQLLRDHRARGDHDQRRAHRIESPAGTPAGRQPCGVAALCLAEYGPCNTGASSLTGYHPPGPIGSGRRVGSWSRPWT